MSKCLSITLVQSALEPAGELDLASRGPFSALIFGEDENQDVPPSLNHKIERVRQSGETLKKRASNRKKQ